MWVDVWVEFEGQEHPGEVLKVERGGWVRCVILTDPSWDYGTISARLAPLSTVAVPSGRVRERVAGARSD